MSDILIADPRDDGDLEQFAAVDAESFGEATEPSLTWLHAARERARIRVARVGDRVVGGYGLLPAGQFFGGRSVKAQAVVAVAVAPAWRRRGVAGTLMRDLVHVAHEGGAAVAPLHAATTRLYRRWGWELGDRALMWTVRTSALSAFRGDGEVVTQPEHVAIEALRHAYLTRWDGPLDRPDWWLSVEWDPGADAHQRKIYGWREAGELTGFVRYSQSQQQRWLRVGVEEFIASTPGALRGLLGFLGSMEAQAPELVFYHSALPPRPEVLYLVPDADKVTEVSGRICWMQRIVDLPAAVAQRGWAAGVSGRVELEVSDPARSDGVTAEPARVVLEFADGGAAQLSPGGAGAVPCEIGFLAGWYANTLRTADAVRMGLLSGPADQLALLDAAVAGRDAWMPDYF
jgi:predicted acetyltransferase